MNTKVTPKDFFLWLGAVVSLYTSVGAFITLYFQYINAAFPDALNDYGVDPYSSSIRFAIASLIVFFPLFLILMRIIRKDIQAVPERADLWVRRWALYLTLFFAGLAMAVDFVTLIYTFLDGEIGTRFIFKVVVVFLVAAALFMHFLADAWGYWREHPKKATIMSIAAAVVVLASILAGFFIIGSPQDARMYKFDDQKIADLQNIQWQVLNYYQTTGKMPLALEELQDSLNGFVIPRDPQTGAAYEYSANKLAFRLCASFNKDSRQDQLSQPRALYPEKGTDGDLTTSQWTHGAGTMCFDREIDPARYPVFKK